MASPSKPQFVDGDAAHLSLRTGTAATAWQDLFEGRLTGAPALAFVTSTRARFLFADCRPLTALEATLSYDQMLWTGVKKRAAYLPG